ncbi:MAG: hypothetical protein COV73_06420, partial [Candidatus Omnitrophica bacterium CG11_big_fil_rev_8_21_14_0_20_43_6]
MQKILDDWFKILNLPEHCSIDDNYIFYQFNIYPPLVPASFALFYFLFGLHTGMELLVNTIYLVCAMLAIYGIGRKISNEKVGVLAVFIFSSFPGVISYSRFIFAEFNLMCLIAISLFFLLKTEFFTSRRYSIIFGIFLGLTALTKWEFPLTMLAPCCLYLIYSQFTIKER